MFSEKLAVIFPGMGYNGDKPLLYYAKKMAKAAGYDVIDVTYELPVKSKEILNDKEGMKAAFEIALRQVEEQLSAIEFNKCEKILFVGKSIGTALAASYDKTHNIDAAQLVFTPVPQTFDFLRAGCGTVFHGNADPWCPREIANTKCEELGLELVIVEGGNHSLETGDPIRDIQELEDVMEIVEKSLAREDTDV